jgi:peptidoglycan/xylan/chitin deacetylase (PgdA/CDA1 family)
MLSQPVLAILGFHKVGAPSPGAWETWYYNTEEEFAGYLRYLSTSPWRVIDAATLVRGIAEPDSLPDRAVLLTFDDAYRSIHQVALPLLLQFNYPAVVFVPSDFVGKDSHSFDSNSSEPNEPLCNWDDLQKLDHHGVSVQSHSATHRAFSELTCSEQEEEMSRSKTVLEMELKKKVEILCFPYGDGGGDPQSVSAALEQTGYKAACVYDGHLNPLPLADPYRLSRLTIGRGSDLDAELRSIDQLKARGV